MVLTLRGIAWDHPRARAPLAAAARALRRRREEPIEVVWEARPLAAFEEEPVDRLAEKYDLMLIDHPWIGYGAVRKALLPLDEWLPGDVLAELGRASVGPSYRSYVWEGHTWAVPIDAAAQVSAVREDVQETLAVPRTWQEVEALLGDPEQARRVAWPLNPMHAWSSFLTLCAAQAGERVWDEEDGLEREVAGEALSRLRRYAGAVDPAAREMDPIAALERLAAGGDFAYAPLTFGYVTYARPGVRPHRIAFLPAPAGPQGPVGLLGGVGLAVSASSAHKELACRVAAWLASERVQRGLYVRAGGQPGHLQAWRDERANRMTGDFFRSTLPTLERAFLRPRHPGYPGFQSQAARLIHEAVWGDLPIGEAVSRIRALDRAARGRR